jgi:hypothetical protein
MAGAALRGVGTRGGRGDERPAAALAAWLAR